MTATKYNCISELRAAGFSLADAETLRRIAMTLHRWHELECGDSNSVYSFCVERDETTDRPVMACYYHTGGTRRIPIADREAGAKKRLAAVMAKYPTFAAYIQTDPRGAALYILRPGDVPEGERAESWYTRGIAVYK